MTADYSLQITIPEHEYTIVLADTPAAVLAAVDRLSYLGWIPTAPAGMRSPSQIMHHGVQSGHPREEFFLIVERRTIGGRPLDVSAANQTLEDELFSRWRDAGA